MTVTVDRRASCNVVLGLLIFLFFLVLFCHLDTSMCMAARSRETRVGHVPYILTPPNAGAPLEKVLVWAMQFSHKGAVIEPRGPPKGGSVASGKLPDDYLARASASALRMAASCKS